MPGITHKFQSPKTDSSDTTKVRATNWNNDHKIEDIKAEGENFFWDNIIKRLAIGFAGVYTDIRAAVIEIKNTGPTWNNLGKAWQAIRVSAGGLPINAQFGSDLVGCPEVIHGSIDIPVSATFANHGAGIAGYGRSASTACGGVGVFGGGLVNADNLPGAWGANFFVHNCPTTHNPITHTLPPQFAYNNTNLYGIEVDTGIHPPHAGGITNVTCRGIYLVFGASVLSVNSTINAVEVYAHSENPLSWKNGFFTVDGSCSEHGINLGTTNSGNGVSSQDIILRSRSATGVGQFAKMRSDPDGNFVLEGHSSILLTDRTGTAYLFAANGVLSLAPRVALPTNSAPATATDSGVKGEIRYSDTHIYVCIATNTWKRTALSSW